MMVMPLHHFACFATCTRPAYCGDLCVLDMSTSASVSISTCNGLRAILSKMKSTLLTEVQVQRWTFNQMSGMARATLHHNLHTHNNPRGTSLWQEL